MMEWFMKALTKTDHGGWWRRYLQFRNDRSHIYRTSKDINPYYRPITLFDFRRTNDIADAIVPYDANKKKKKSKNYKFYDKWRISDDRVIGGYTKSYMKLIQTQKEQDDLSLSNIHNIVSIDRKDQKQRLESTSSSPINESDSNNDLKTTKNDNKDTMNSSSTDQSNTDLLSIPYLRWYGNIDTDIGFHSDVQRSGFAAIRSPEYSKPTSIFFGNDGANLSNMYNAIEIICRSYDHHIYTINLKIATAIPDDIYQTSIQPNIIITTYNNNDNNDNVNGVMPSNNNNIYFHQIIIPFNQFAISSIGRGTNKNIKQSNNINLILDDTIKIESIGFIIKDEQNGPFIFDLVRVRAVNMKDDDTNNYYSNKDNSIIYDPIEYDDNNDDDTSITERKIAREEFDSIIWKDQNQNNKESSRIVRRKMILHNLIEQQQQQQEHHQSITDDEIKKV